MGREVGLLKGCGTEAPPSGEADSTVECETSSLGRVSERGRRWLSSERELVMFR